MASNLKANEAGPSPRMAALTRERRQAAEEDGAGEQMVDVANNPQSIAPLRLGHNLRGSVR